MKRNCWEAKQCGREQGGEHAIDLGICPASTDTGHDGRHSGKNGGRFCWAVAGTFCGGVIQGTFAEKRTTCMGCDFFLEVQDEEGIDFHYA